MEEQPGQMENMAGLEGLKRCFGRKKVFVTGHTGFKGSWLLQILRLADAGMVFLRTTFLQAGVFAPGFCVEAHGGERIEMRCKILVNATGLESEYHERGR